MLCVKHIYCVILIVLFLLPCAACESRNTAESLPAQTFEVEASSDHSMEGAVGICFVYPEFGVDVLEYEIDLDGQELRRFDSDDHTERNPEAESGGWTHIESLTEEQVAEIRRICAPMLQWEESYENPDVQDGWHWHITITFRDGGTYEVYGANAWPENYVQMGRELRETGVEVGWLTELPEWATS